MNEEHTRKIGLYAALDEVKWQRKDRDKAHSSFVASIRQAHDYGASYREIAAAAGYKSPASIQKILAK